MIRCIFYSLGLHIVLLFVLFVKHNTGGKSCFKRQIFDPLTNIAESRLSNPHLV